ncbi:MAG: hypothetical protein AAB538_05710 [Patescibacteria group bacterium]
MTPQRAKEIGIVVSVLLISLLLFALVSLFIAQDRFGSTPVVAVTIVLAVLWVGAVAVALAVLQHPGSSSSLIAGIAAMLAVAGLLQLPAIVAALLLALFLTVGRRTMYHEINNRVLYRTHEVFSRGLRSILFGVGIAALGLAWPLVEEKLTGTNVLLPTETVGAVVNRVVPALPPHLKAFLDVGQLTGFVTLAVNQMIQSLISSYRLAFLLIVLLIAISAYRAVLPLITWGILPVIAGLIYLARKANLIYLSRSQATIERLHL